MPKLTAPIVTVVPDRVADKVAGSYSGSGQQFENAGFGKFLARRGVTGFDPVSGRLNLGERQVVVTSDGAVSGDANLQRRVERWIFEYLHQ